MKTHELKFYAQLKDQLANFNLHKAELLSSAIHEAEIKGYEISKQEDRLWIKLTEKIVDIRSMYPISNKG